MSVRSQVLEHVREVPALPALSLELLQLMNDPGADITMAARVVGLDPVLMASALRMANAAAMGTRETVCTARDALVRVGLKRMVSWLVTETVAPYAAAPVKGYGLAPQVLLRHSVAVGLASEHLAKAAGLKPAPWLYTAGLMHDIGKVVLSTFLKVDVETISTTAFLHQQPFEVAEQRVLGIDHAEAGALLLERGGVPEPICSVARWHHQPHEAGEVSPELRLVHVADVLVKAGGIGLGADGLHHVLSRECITALRITPLQLEQTLQWTLDELAGMDGVMTGMKGEELDAQHTACG